MDDDLNPPLFSCSQDGCREEVSYPADMLQMHDGKPFCEECYDNLPHSARAADPDDEGGTLAWWQLRPFVPAHVAQAFGLRFALLELCNAEAEYRKAHDLHGDGSPAAGRAWDLMRRAGDRARDLLGVTGRPVRPATAGPVPDPLDIPERLDFSNAQIGRYNHLTGKETSNGD